MLEQLLEVAHHNIVLYPLPLGPAESLNRFGSVAMAETTLLRAAVLDEGPADNIKNIEIWRR